MYPVASNDPLQQALLTRFKCHLIIIFVLLFYIGLAILATWPLAMRLDDSLLGHRDIDVWNHVWGFWWFKLELLEHHRLPLHADTLGYPEGGRLYFIDPLNALLSIPFQVLFGLIVAYNLVLLLELTLAGFATHLLARETGASHRGAALAGLLVVLSPVLRCEMYNGITEVGNVGWLALAMLMTYRLFRTGEAIHALLAGVFAAIAFVACWYYGLAIAGFTVLWAFLEAARNRLGPRAAFRFFKPAGIFVVTAAAITAPFLFVFLWTLEGTGSIIKRAPGLNAFLIRHNATDLLSFLLPGNYHSPDLWLEHQERFLHTTYIGLVALCIALWGIRARLTRGWAIVGAVFAVFALGPYLFVGGQFVTVVGKLVPLPFAILSHGIGLMAITHPGRMVIVTLLCLAVIVAHGLDVLEARFSSISRVFLPTLGCAMLLELLLASPAPFPMATASATHGPGTRLLAEDLEPGAVLDVPVQHLETMRTSRFLYDQTLHGRPTPYLVNVRAQSTKWLHHSFIYQWIRALPNATDMTIPDRIHAVPDAQWIRSVRDDFQKSGYRYIRIHRKILSPPFGVWPYRHFFDPALGPPIATPDGYWIYRLEPLDSGRGGRDG